MTKYIKNVWEWVKEHKKEIAIVGAVSIVSAAGGIVLYKKFDSASMRDCYLPMLDISAGNDRYHGGGVQIAIYDDSFSLDAMGKLGEHIAENIPDLPDNPSIVYAEFVMAK